MAKLKSKKKSEPDIKAFFEFVKGLSTEKNLSYEKVLEVVHSSFLEAYQKKYGLYADIKVNLSPDEQILSIVHRRNVVEKVRNSDIEISLEDACKDNSNIQLRDTVEEIYDPFHSSSRVLAVDIRHAFLQRLKELERELIYNDFKDKQGELINGYFLRWRDREVVYVDIGRTEGILPHREQIPGERFRPGDRVKAIIKNIELKREKGREIGPFIILSRASSEFVRKLFKMEIPEIYDGVVEIVNVARQAGYRTKLLVRSSRQDVDPVGACVGIKGVRIQSIVRELGNERIDIVNEAQEAQQLISNALSPAEVIEVRVDIAAKEAFVIVSDNSYSVAIGNSGHNVRLACQLTKYHISVRSQSQFNEEMASPDAKARLETLFQSQKEEVQEEVSTSLREIPGLTQRVIALLSEEDICSVEELLELSEDELANLSGMGKTTAKEVRRILSETVEFEEV